MWDSLHTSPRLAQPSRLYRRHLISAGSLDFHPFGNYFLIFNLTAPQLLIEPLWFIRIYNRISNSPLVPSEAIRRCGEVQFWKWSCLILEIRKKKPILIHSPNGCNSRPIVRIQCWWQSGDGFARLDTPTIASRFQFALLPSPQSGTVFCSAAIVTEDSIVNSISLKQSKRDMF